jgi:hypothetical protein
MKEILKYLKLIHSAMSDVSSKRFYGGIVVIVTLVMICIFRHGDLYYTFLGGCGLLGLGILDKLKK